VEQGTWEWLNYRQRLPTGSKAYDWCVKRRSRGKGGVFPPEAREAMEHGKKWEAHALLRYAEKVEGAEVKDGKMWMHRHVAASPDGITTDGVIVEVKCPYWRQIQEGTMPIQDWWQVQAEMEASGLEEADYIEMDFCGNISIKRIFKEPGVTETMQECFNKEKIRREMARKVKVDD